EVAHGSRTRSILRGALTAVAIFAVFSRLSVRGWCHILAAAGVNSVRAPVKRRTRPQLPRHLVPPGEVTGAAVAFFCARPLLARPAREWICWEPLGPEWSAGAARAIPWTPGRGRPAAGG